MPRRKQRKQRQRHLLPRLQQHAKHQEDELTTANNNNQDMYHLFWPEPPQLHEKRVSLGDNEEDEDEDENDADDEDELRDAILDSIVKIHCTHSEPDFLIPWQKQHQSTSTSSGFVVELLLPSSPDDTATSHRQRIMTNAHSVEYGSIVQVQRRGEEQKYEAVVEVMANECDLAILHIPDPTFWFHQDDDDDDDDDNVDGNGDDDDNKNNNKKKKLLLKSLEFGPLPQLQEEVDVLGYPTGGDSLSITTGVVSRIERNDYEQASTHLLCMQVDAAINPGNSGGPVVNDRGEVIGVAFQGLDEAQNIGYVVPVTVVQHLLYDIQRHDGKYAGGFCSLGIDVAFLENKSFRKSLGMTDRPAQAGHKNAKDLSGIMVRKADPLAPSANILQPNDVILQIDGIPVANDGKVPFRPGERVAMTCYIQTKFVGDAVQLKLLRQSNSGGGENSSSSSEIMDLECPVSIRRRLVPSHFENHPPPYLIVGGFVFTALSIPFLDASDAWREFVSENMSFLLGKVKQPLQRHTDQVVILPQVLAHRSNLGYDKLSDLVLEKVNGQTVHSLEHLKQILDHDNDHDFLTFEFKPGNEIVVLERSQVEQATKDVCREHSILRPYYFGGGGGGGINGSDDEEEGEEGA